MSELWSDGVLLMVLGMGTVYVFLSVSVVAVTLMSKLLMRWPESQVDSKKRMLAASHRHSQDELAAVMAIAYQQASLSAHDRSN